MSKSPDSHTKHLTPRSANTTQYVKTHLNKTAINRPAPQTKTTHKYSDSQTLPCLRVENILFVCTTTTEVDEHYPVADRAHFNLPTELLWVGIRDERLPLAAGRIAPKNRLSKTKFLNPKLPPKTKLQNPSCNSGAGNAVAILEPTRKLETRVPHFSLLNL